MADRSPLPPATTVAGPEPSPPRCASPRALVESHAFLSQEQQGLFATLARLPDQEAALACVEAVFKGGYYFKDLSYKNLQAILYDLAAVKTGFKRLLLARCLAPLSPRREALYQGELALGKHEALYDFTQLADSRERFAKGVRPPAAEEQPRAADEFVAVMWKRGVRFGLDMAAAAQGLAVRKNQYLRLCIAQARAPHPGEDARTEALISLEKDLRPLETPEGEVDLKRYQCVFPQAREGQVILRKIPASAGVEGRTLAGQALPAAAGKDLDLARFKGPGTELGVVGRAECLVAAQAGFVSVHPRSGAVSVTNEVINHTPVGLKTGNLTIEAESIVQYGGVGPGYQLEGNNLVFKSGAVEGAVVSRQGAVTVEGNVTGGQVTALAGDVLVKGRVLAGSRLEAYRGQVSAEYAEKCLLIGRAVSLRKAVNATIIAETATIGESKSCNILALSMKLDRVSAGGAAGVKQGLPPAGATLVVPIVEVPKRPLAILRHTLGLLVEPLPRIDEAIERINSDTQVQMYMRALGSYVRAESEEQAHRAQAVLQPLEDKVRPVVGRWRELKAEKAALELAKAGLEAEIEQWRAKIQRLEQDLQGGMQVQVGSVWDDSLTLKLYKDARMPLHFQEIAELDPAQRAQFESLCRRMLSALVSGHTRERTMPLRGPFSSSYRDLRKLLDEAPDVPASAPAPQEPAGGQPGNRRRERRLTLLGKAELVRHLAEPGRQLPPQQMILRARADELLEGYVLDMSGLGLGLAFPRAQRYAPLFSPGEKIAVELMAGAATLEAELVPTFVEHGPQLVRVGGYFVNLSPAFQALLYRLKNALESRTCAEEKLC